MHRLYTTNPIHHFLAWVALYLVVSLTFATIGMDFGLSYQASVVLPLGVLSLGLLLYLLRTGINEHLGLATRAEESPARMWFHLPLLLLVCLPLAFGIRADLGVGFVAVVIATAVFIGFLEEVLIRGMLLRSLFGRGQVVLAVLLSAMTFGFGHVARLAIGNPSPDVLLLIINATLVGLVLTLVVIASGNLHAAIVAHSLFNVAAVISPVPDGAILLIPSTIVLVIYGAWLLYGAGALDKMKAAKAHSREREATLAGQGERNPQLTQNDPPPRPARPLAQ